jgi:CubicO group peptidase (beta-lactamase class C family)
MRGMWSIAMRAVRSTPHPARWAGLFASLALATTLPLAAQTHFPADSLVREIVRPHVAPGEGVGIVVGLIEADGTRRFITVGEPAVEGRALDANTVFEIGSITKTFTGILLAEMAERGEVRLNEPVAALLPDSVRTPSRAGREITLLDLATQSSGLPRLPTNMRPANVGNPYADYGVDMLYAFLAEYELTRDVGEMYEYSNLGVGLLGHALALRADTSYEALVRARILEPLGMASTAIVLDDALRSRLAPGHNALGQVVPNWDLPTIAGAGALRSTATDMLAYLAANLDPPDSALGRAIHRSHEPRVATDNPDLRVGLAWHMLSAFDRTIVWHNGGTGGYRSMLAFDGDRGIGVVMLTNSNRGVDDIALHLLEPRIPLPTR